MKKNVRLTAAAISVTAVLLLAGCSYQSSTSTSSGSGSASAKAASGGDLTVVATGGLGEITSLDPIAPGRTNSDPMDAVFGELVFLGPNNAVQPGLAQSWNVSSDGLTITFKLRSGLTFSDGTPLNAQAVKTAWDRDLDPKNASAALSTYGTIASTAATDATTFTVTLSKPMPAFLTSLSGDPLNWITDPNQSPSEYATKPIGAGPFAVQSFVTNQQLVLTKNSTAYNKPYLDKLTFQIIGSDQSAYAAVQSGQAQIVEGITTPSIFTEAKQQFNVVSTHSTQVWMNEFNTVSGPLSNIKARQALIYATDASAINKGVFDGQNQLAQMGIAPGLPFYEKTVPGALSYDPAKAKALVQELGGLKVQIMETTSLVGQQIAQALQAQWAAVGITATLVNPSLSQKLAEMKAGSWTVSTNFAGASDPTGTLGVNFFFGSTGPSSGTKNPQLDALINSAATETNQTKRADDYKQIWQLIVQNSYAGFMFTNETYNIVAKSVANGDQSVGLLDWSKVSLGSSN